jgi:hypothetical protein
MPDPPPISRLEIVDVREVWQHEAHVFTPWLAENLDRLNEVIGLQLELEGTEASVGSFSADILARDVQSGAMAIIENQLEGSDHSHLGQCLTYLTGLDAKVMIWVATSFRESHRSAVDWLNRHTTDEFAFFAVTVQAARIGDSPYAPLFEVIAKPNHWERELRATSDVGWQRHIERWKAFWAAAIEQYPSEAERSYPITPASNRWRDLEDLGLVLSLYVSTNSVGLCIRGPRGMPSDVLANRLRPHLEDLHQSLGIAMDAEERNFWGVYLRGDPNTAETRGPMVDWLMEQAERYERKLRQILG